MTKMRTARLLTALVLVVSACNKKDDAVIDDSAATAPAEKTAEAPIDKGALPKTPADEATALTALAAGAVATPQMAILNAKSPEAGVVTGGQPTEAQFREAKEKGFKIIINTRSEGEPGVSTAKQLIEGLGMKYVWIPMKGADGLTKGNAKALADALSDENKPALVYCRSGNRVGGLFAMKAFHVDGRSIDEALAIGKKAGLTRLEAAVKDKLSK